MGKGSESTWDSNGRSAAWDIHLQANVNGTIIKVNQNSNNKMNCNSDGNCHKVQAMR